MAWTVTGQTLCMSEDDFGNALPMELKGMTLGAQDCIRMDIKDHMNGSTILTKEWSDIQQNTVSIVFTEEESKLLPVGTYVYNLAWYQEGNFRNYIIECATLKVGDVA